LEPDSVLVSKKNDVYIDVKCDRSIARELVDYFTFEVPGAKFMPAVRNRYWDGKIRLFNQNQTLYYGLLPHVAKFCKQREYGFNIDDTIEPAENFSRSEAEDFADTLGLPFEPREYQIEAFTYAVRNRRGVLVSPTASGKSLIIYLLSQYYQARTLVIVPTISLVHQMAGDFKSYGYQDDCHMITAGVDKITDKQITVSTWQSIYKMPKNWFKQFDVVVGDEAHLFKAKSLTSIMTKLESCKYRFGLTGTLDDAQTHKLVLEGLFGPVKQIVKTKTLIDQKHLAEFKIKCIVLKYDETVCKTTKDYKYQDEVDWIVRNDQRNRFITNLSLSLKGNSLILFQFVDKHGKVLYNMIKDKAGDRPVHYVSGETDAAVREDIRAITEQTDDGIIVASFGTFSTGINIRNLHNIVFTSPSKSRVRTLQSIGRGLRKGETKDSATLIDLADDLTHRSRVNFTLKHFAERVKLYNEEGFDYKIYKVKIHAEKAIQTPTII
tara:strand:+ start:2602 stop:4080 length:1479 start_codon:yes stop_codon:yes gene_type:complete